MPNALKNVTFLIKYIIIILTLIAHGFFPLVRNNTRREETRQTRFSLFPSILISPFRSPSPEPIYSSDGKRMNTREYRKRKELEEKRHRAIQRMIQINPDYKPPPDYK